MRKKAPRESGERVRLECYMKPGLLRAVELLAEREDSTVSAITREALRDLLRKRGLPVPDK